MTRGYEGGRSFMKSYHRKRGKEGWNFLLKEGEEEGSDDI